MVLSVILVLAFTVVLVPASSAIGGGDAAGLVESVQTHLGPPACRTEIDRTDPNETAYLLCPGVGGYALIVRRVDSGRRSIDLVDPAGRVYPLHYEEFVTRHMSTLSDKAEWRVGTRNGRQVPVALIVRVQAREDASRPETVTRTYAAVAKITPDAACVTDVVPESAQSATELRSAAESAQDRPCAPPRPPMAVDGAAIR